MFENCTQNSACETKRGAEGEGGGGGGVCCVCVCV